MTDDLVLKVVDAISNNRLVGDVVFSDEEYQLLIDYIRNVSFLFYRNRGSFNTQEKQILFVTLVEMAKRWKRLDYNNDDDGFWDYVFKLLFEFSNPNQILYKEYSNIIKDLGRTNKIIMANHPKKYWATIMMHAFSPESSLNAFFELCFNIYCEDLNFNYNNQDIWICEALSCCLREKFENSPTYDKPISINSSLYSIRIGLRMIVCNDVLHDDFIRLSNITLQAIDKLFHQKKFSFNGYFESLIDEWWKNKISDVYSAKKNISNVISSVAKQNISVKFIRNNETVKLVIPPIRIENYSNIIWLSVYVGEEGSQRFSEPLKTRSGQLTTTTVQKEFELDELLSDIEIIRIRVEITEYGTTLFDKEISRDFILFDGESEILGQLNKVGNYYFYTRNIDEIKTPSEIKTYSTNLYNIYPREGEMLEGKTRQVHFIDNVNVTNNKNEIKLIGNYENYEWLIDDSGGLVFLNQVMLLIANDTMLNGLDLMIDDKRFLLSDLTYQQEIQYRLFDISNLVSKNKLCDIKVYSYMLGKVFLWGKIVVFPELKVTQSRVYYGDDEKKLTIFDGKTKTDLCWENSDNEVIYPYNNGLLVVKIPYIRWRVDDNNWNNKRLDKPQWYKQSFNQASTLEIDPVLDLEKVLVFALSDGIQTQIERNKNGKFDVGKYIYATENKTEIMFLMKTPDVLAELFIVSTKEHFTSNPLIFTENEVLWNPEETFIGNNTRQFNLSLKMKNGEVFLKKNLQCLDSVIDKPSDGIYKINISSETGTLFAKETVDFFEGELLVGCKEKFRFEGKYIQLVAASIVINNNVNVTSYWKPFASYYGIDKLEFTKIDGEECYIGHLFSIKKNGDKIYLNNLINISGKYEKINPVRVYLTTNDSLEIDAGHNKDDLFDFLGGLTYDVKSQNICNINAMGEKAINYPFISLYKYIVRDENV